MAAGNAGHNPYIVGSPSTTDEAISVAASVDNMDHNYKFAAVAFKTTNHEKLLAQAIEAGTTISIEEAGDVTGRLVYAGAAEADLSDELKAKLIGNVALIDRGFVSFDDKIKRAQDAGAIAVVVANNAGGPINADYYIVARRLDDDLVVEYEGESHEDYPNGNEGYSFNFEHNYVEGLIKNMVQETVNKVEDEN